MDKAAERFMSLETQSKARIVDRKQVEVIAPDGETFAVISSIGTYDNEETRAYCLHLIEYVFDISYTEDKEEMYRRIWLYSSRYAANIIGISTGNRQEERTRIGRRIRQIRLEKGLEARDLAKFAGIDAANLSRIEQGKYSVGLDILSKIAAAMGKKIDFVEL